GGWSSKNKSVSRNFLIPRRGGPAESHREYYVGEGSSGARRDTTLGTELRKSRFSPRGGSLGSVPREPLPRIGPIDFLRQAAVAGHCATRPPRSLDGPLSLDSSLHRP